MTATNTAAPDFGPPKNVTLSNPVAHHFPAFAFGNSLHCDRVVEANSADGQTVVICGAGPSLREHAEKWTARGDQVWGCNSALTWLVEHGYKATHGFTVDQTAHMCNEWVTAPEVEYLLASTVHPHLTEWLMEKQRSFRFFHNYVGMKEAPVAYSVCRACDGMGDSTATKCQKCGSTELIAGRMDFEDWMYSNLYPATIRAGSGLNAVTRAIDVALFMGFKKIVVLGADCALRMKSKPPKVAAGSPEHLDWLRTETEMHADGGSALASDATPVTFSGTIDGREWLVKPDLMITAVWLVKMKRKLGSQLSIIGDTLPRALLSKSDEYLDRLPTLCDSGGVPLPTY